VRPYYRKNTMEMTPSWMVTYDPNQREYEFESYGVNSKYHKRFESGDVIVGLDTDYTPSSYQQHGVSVLGADDAPCYERKKGYVSACQKTVKGDEQYNYTANQTSVSPYVHAEYVFANNTKVDAGLRYDHFSVDYTDRMDSNVPETIGRSTHLRPASQTLHYEKVSPKLGVTHRLNDKHALFASHKHSFRAPSIGRLFTSGSTPNTDALKPVKAVSNEVGVRGVLGKKSTYDLSVYHMQVKDDIVNIVKDGDRQITNAGKTEHAGVELSLGHAVSDDVSMTVATSYRKQRYDDFSGTFFNSNTFKQEQVDFSGNDLPRAPKLISNVSVTYEPTQLPGATFELEWQGLSSYFSDEQNTQTYDGHRLLNLRAHYDVDKHTRVYGRVTNVTDESYSNYSSKSVGGGDMSHNPGAPRSVYVGIKKEWK
ncbi:MAG: TonB-dependent receptor, partial [Pseudomonadota bacterium]